MPLHHLLKSLNLVVSLLKELRSGKWLSPTISNHLLTSLNLVVSLLKELRSDKWLSPTISNKKLSIYHLDLLVLG